MHRWEFPDDWVERGFKDQIDEILADMRRYIPKRDAQGRHCRLA